MALADAFLADLEDDDLDDVEEFGDEFDGNVKNEEEESEGFSEKKGSKKDFDTDMMDVHVAGLGTPKTVRDVTKLSISEKYISVIGGINVYMAKGSGEMTGVLEDDPEYKLIVEANEVAAEITHEIILVHKFVRDIYTKKFPDLETLVPTPMEYIRTVLAIKNESDLTTVDLGDILPAAQIMIVVTASTAGGTDIVGEELKRLEDGCAEALKLEADRERILTYVESRMSYIAPNLVELVGSSIAARLMADAGGLTALSLMPACNIQNIGARRKTLAGFSSRQLTHAGHIMEADLIANAPPFLKTKALRMVLGRCMLAARLDNFRDCPSGEKGREFRDEIEKKLEKFNEPAPAKRAKALPLPSEGETKKKRRGGRRYRKQKELLAMTELRKQANRVKFGREGQTEYMGAEFGMLGMDSGAGSVASKLRVTISTQGPKLSKKRQKQLERESGFKTSGFKTARYTGGTATTSGFASNFAITPVQGLELDNPDIAAAAQAKAEAANRTYFSETGGFRKVGKKEE